MAEEERPLAPAGIKRMRPKNAPALDPSSHQHTAFTSPRVADASSSPAAVQHQQQDGNVPVPAATAPHHSSGQPTTSLSAAVQLFQGGVASVQSLLDTLIAAAQTERDELQQARQKLAEEKAAFEEEKQAVQAVFRDGDQVVLNVGGLRFTTTVNTLRGAPSPSLFAAMFSGRHAVQTAPDGSVFIDRDGRHFADILNYLRTQQLAYPHDGTDYKYLLELHAEAEYYGLMGLVRLIDRYPYGLTHVVRGLLRTTEDTWVYEDGPDEVVLRVDRPVQLLGVGLCGSESGYTAELEVLEVGEDFSEEVASLATAAQSFTKADGPICRMFLGDPVLLLPDRYYMLSVLVKGSESYCCEDAMETVVAGGVRVSFQCWESPNGTSESRGQFPELYVRVVSGTS